MSTDQQGPDAFEQLPIIEQMRLAAACWQHNGERGACSPSAESLLRQAKDCERWCDEVERLQTIVRSVNRIISQNEPYRWKVERIVAALGETS